jgi:gamma-glutamyltranspeptidase/glutathione hydrolase
MCRPPRTVGANFRVEVMNTDHRDIVALIFLVVVAITSSADCQAAAAGTHGVVASVDEYASKAGVEVLKACGNAIDAAVAVHMVLAVTHPQAGNLGGGGFMIVHMEGHGEEDDVNTAIDFREKAPLASRRDMYLDEAGEVIPEASTLGYLACGVPGSVAGLWGVHQKYGTLPWSELLEPAYRLAKDGFIVGPLLATDLRDAHEKLTEFPASAAIFTKDGEPFDEGDVLIQEDLAWTIKKIMDGGMDGFYKGEVAARIAADMKANGGLITEEDLARYHPYARRPITGAFAGYTVVSMPPPSSGGLLLCQMLAMLADYDLKELSLNSPDYIQLLTEVEKLAYADRAEFLGDADFFAVPVDHLLSPDYIALRASDINLERATPSRSISHGPAGVTETVIQEMHSSPPEGESSETTHFSIVDRHGNAVSCTTTLNGRFGSCVVAEGTGVLLNNEMDDFSMKPGVPNIYGLVGGEANAIAPGKRMLSSMTPTIVLEGSDIDAGGAGGDVKLVLGSPGGSTIITTVLQVILNVLVHDLQLDEAVGMPRFHHQWLPDETRVEAAGIPQAALENLEKMGHVIREVNALGDVHAILVERPRGEGASKASGDAPALLIGVSDPRRGGAALGY